METGKIYWLSGDFKFLNYKEPDCWDSEAKVESSVVDSNMIRFHTEKIEFDDGDYSGFTVNLLATKDDVYTGEAIKIESGEFWSEVTCELFENKSKYLLKGTWIESFDDEDLFYTWILILDKKKK